MTGEERGQIMSDTLTRDPLMMSISFVDGHTIDPDYRPPTDGSSQPLGYLYSEWDGVTLEPAWGEFDEETQTWSDPPGMLPTAGITTYTTTNCRSTDRCIDDNCS
jgi:hypothetical protein